MQENPFIIEPYGGKEYFCDRETETAQIIKFLENGNNVTLISPRRYGKTGLIYRIFDELGEKKNKVATCYCDILSATNLDDFIRLFSEAIVKSVDDSIIRKLFSLLANVRPLLSFDPMSGIPQISFTFQGEDTKTATLKSILDFLESQRKKFFIAIDEFQQIRQFKESNMEALLRTYIQNLHNVKFIFCGSKQHIMADIFSNAKNPFYESSRFLHLDKINSEKYQDFITRMFAMGKRKIDDASVEFILQWTRSHTFYTQQLCHTIYSNGVKNVDMSEVKKACVEILRENAPTFYMIRDLITDAQWNFLIAVSKDGCVSQPTSGNFLSKHHLGNASSALRIVNSLMEKELLLQTSNAEGKSYSVYNVFMSRWMEQL